MGKVFHQCVKLYGLLEYYAVIKLYHIDYIYMDHLSSKTTTIIIIDKALQHLYGDSPVCIFISKRNSTDTTGPGWARRRHWGWILQGQDLETRAQARQNQILHLTTQTRCTTDHI